MVSVKDVAAAASVSVGTVSNVLNRRATVLPETAARVQRAIDELGFVRNDAARQLRAGRSRSIGLVVPDIGNPFFAEVARGAQARAFSDGMSVLLVSSDGGEEQQNAHLELFQEQRVNGVLVTPPSADLTALRRLRERGIPVVVIDRDIDDRELPAVAVDNVEGGYLAASHLIELGRRKIAFVAGPRAIPQVADRLTGARRAVAQASGVELEVVDVPALTVQNGRDAGRWLANRSADRRPDAVFTSNDLLAVGALQAFVIGGGIRVPDDIALIGFDDIDFAAAAIVPLTSIRQPAQQIGYSAVDLLLAELDEPDALRAGNVRFRPELVVRQSTIG